MCVCSRSVCIRAKSLEIRVSVRLTRSPCGGGLLRPGRGGDRRVGEGGGFCQRKENTLVQDSRGLENGKEIMQ